METNHSEKNTDLNSANLIEFLFKWRKPLIIFTTVGAIVSIIGSLLIQNKYKSTVILFPTTTSSISKALLSENNTGKEDILKLGEEEEAEQMLQILNSDEIRTKIIEKYNLMKHYDIKENEKYRYTKLQKKFESNVTFKRTKFMSVEISVLDHSADTAALIANDIAALLDTVKNRMRREIAYQGFQIVEDEYNSQMGYIAKLEDSLKYIRSLGVISVEEQAQSLTEQYSIAILQGKTSAAKVLENKLDTLSKYAGIFTSIEDQKLLESERLVMVRSKYKEALVDLERELQHKFIVNAAQKAEKKSYPIRWLIVVISTFSSFLFTLVILLFVESIKNTKLER